MKHVDFQYEVIKNAIKEIGPINVVHVITDATTIFRLAGSMIQSKYKHLFWTPYCVHTLNNVLKDIGKKSRLIMEHFPLYF